MPPTAPATTSARPRVTDIVARVHATHLDVCRQGNLVGLHLATTAGVVMVTMDVGEFVRAARGPRDHNGNALPTWTDPEALRQEEAPVGDVVPVAEPERPTGDKRRASPERIALYRSLWDRWRNSRDCSVSRLAQEAGITSWALYKWFAVFKAEESE